MWCSHLTAMGQTTIELEQFGVGNSFRPGGPVGIKLKVTSDLDEVTTGVIQWEIENGDGDIAEYSRQLTIPFRGASTSIWLYGNLPPAPQASALMEENWTFRIFETSEGEKVREIANVRLAPQTAMNAPLALEMSADQILMIGPNLAGLQGYQPVAGFQGNPTLNNITITSSGGLAQDEIDRMVQEAESMKDADEKQKNSVQVRRGCFRAFPREFSVF